MIALYDGMLSARGIPKRLDFGEHLGCYPDLRFRLGLALYKEHVDSMHDRTEGWIAGLQMVAVSMQG
jgi:hypothetical protein